VGKKRARGARNLVPPFTHTDTDDIILLYTVPLTIVSNLMTA